jgi:hypothetical protein
MELDQALEIARRLRGALAAELERARGERQLLRALDGPGLFARASQRAAFLADAAQLERELARELARAAGELEMAEVTLARLRARAPGPGGQLSDVMSEVRALTGALHELDQLNLQLAGRALACVRGYVEALRPVPRAYDRRGLRAGAPALTLVSSKG